jgi:DNA-binding NarL/FixJ family response regulator
VFLLSRKEKEKLVIKLANEGKLTWDIAKEVYISLKNISKIIHKVTDDTDLNGQKIEKEIK